MQTALKPRAPAMNGQKSEVSMIGNTYNPQQSSFCVIYENDMTVLILDLGGIKRVLDIPLNVIEALESQLVGGLRSRNLYVRDLRGGYHQIQGDGTYKACSPDQKNFLLSLWINR